MLTGGGNLAWGQPTASEPSTGETYYLYNPSTQLFLTTDGGSVPYVKPAGCAWTIETSDVEGYVKLRMQNNATGYFWGKYWAEVSSSFVGQSYAGEVNMQLVATGTDSKYKIHSYAWNGTDNAYVYINTSNANRIAANSNEQAGLDEALTIWQFVTESDYRTYLDAYIAANGSIDMTAHIANPNAASDGSGWTAASGTVSRNAKNGFDGNAGFFEPSNWGAASWNQTYSQTISNLPNGYYRVKVAAQIANSPDKIWQKLIANGYESYFMVNGDANGNIKADGSVTTIGGDGTYQGWRYNDVVAKVTDGTLTITISGAATAEHLWSNFDNVTLAYLGNTVSSSSPANLTGLLKNANLNAAISNENWTYANPGTGNLNRITADKNEDRGYEIYHGQGEFSQSLTNMPNGLYRVYVQAAWRDQNQQELYATTALGESTATVTQTVTSNAAKDQVVNMFNDATWGRIYTDVNVTDGNLTVGFREKNAGAWTVFDNFQLFYYGPTVGGEALALPDGGAMVAGQWYYFDVATAADNYLATATTLTNIVYTTNPDILIENESTVTAHFTAEDNSLSATRYYVKSSSSNNLEISVAAHTYVVGSASANVAYIQEGNTVTVSYPDATTTDTSASLTTDFSGVTFGGNSISVTPTANGFTFTVPTVTAATDYTLAIPAGAIGYSEGSTYNEAQNIVLKTPAIFDGYYFLRTSGYKYLSRGGNYNTQAIADDYGVPMRVTTNANNITEFIFIDNWFHLFDGDGGTLFTDNNTYPNFEVEATDGGYYVINRNTTASSSYGGKMYIDTADGNRVKSSTTNSTVWQFEDATTTAHKLQMQALKDAQAAAVATSAGISASTQAAMASELSANYGETDIAITGTGGTNSQSWKQGGGKERDSGPLEIFKETVSGLTPGLYRLSVKALERITWYGDVANVGGAAGLTYVYANDQKVQLYSLFDYPADASLASGDVEINGKYYPDTQSSAQAYFDAGKYSNDVYVYVTADEGETTGSITFGINKPHRYGNDGDRGAWICYNDFSLVRFDAKPTDAEKEALADAIDAAEAKTLGFENKEYAPYNNVDAIVALAAAKAIVPETASGAAVVAATTALTTATSAMVANDGEVNAIYWDYSTLATTDKSKAYGWYDPALSGNAEGSMYATRVFNHVNGIKGDGTDSNPGLAAVNHNVALFTKISTNYGKVEGYTLPLKANRTYKLAFKYAGWTEPSESTISITDENGENPLAISGVVTVSGTAQNGNSSTKAWANYEGYFAVPADGNYILNINRINMGGHVQRQLVMGNIDLRTASALEFADGTVPTYAPGTYPTVKITRSLTADRWATAVYPFAVSGVDNIAVLDSYNKETGALGFTSAAASVANEPFLMRSTSDKTEITLSNVGVSATAASPAITKSEASLKGAYTTTDITNAEKNYVLSSNKIYSVGTAGATINPYRAYIQIDQTVNARALSFFIDGDETTGIEGINAETKAIEGTVYNLQGQRVEKAQKGLFIKNGKKVVIK